MSARLSLRPLVSGIFMTCFLGHVLPDVGDLPQDRRMAGNRDDVAGPAWEQEVRVDSPRRMPYRTRIQALQG
jgi:hypothetical protein